MNIFRLPPQFFYFALARLTLGQTIAAIWVRRMFIRYHRDQRWDDRCWADDWLVWQLLTDTPPMPRFGSDVGMHKCEAFYENRRSTEEDTWPRGVILDSERWDDDLWQKSAEELTDELVRMQGAIGRHRDGAVIEGRPQNIDDDRLLYAVLPEGLPADFRLPPREEFLGEAKAPHAGCRSFWRSHADCAAALCNLHQWGPCGLPKK